MTVKYENGIGRIIKQRRRKMRLTLCKLSDASGVSPSYIARIEGGTRYPSGSVLRSLARPLGFNENELFSLAGYMSSKMPVEIGADEYLGGNRVDPLVAAILSQETPEVQRAVIAIFTLLKNAAINLPMYGKAENKTEYK